MKKIFRVSNWGAIPLTAETIETHWFPGSLKQCIQMLGFNPTITFNDQYHFTISIPGFSNTYKVFYCDASAVGFKANNSQFIWYVNTETKEICGCACCQDVITFDPHARNSSQFVDGIGNFLRCSIVDYSSRNGTRFGPELCLKFSNNKIVGSTFGGQEFVVVSTSGSTGKVRYLHSQVGNVLGDRTKTEAISPGIVYKIRSQRKPILDGTIYSSDDYGQNPDFNALFFESIFDTTRYFTTPTHTADFKKYMYDGKMFDVDDARDIGIIPTTI